MVKELSFWKRVKKAGAVFVAVGMLHSSVAPAPAHAMYMVFDPFRAAVQMAGEALEFPAWTALQGALTLQGDAIVAYFTAVTAAVHALAEEIKRTGLGVSASVGTLARGMGTSAQGVSDGMTKSALLAAELDLALEQMGAPNEQICKFTFGYQTSLTTEVFEESVSRIVLEGAAGRARCADCVNDGNGPGYTAWSQAMRFGSPPGTEPSSNLTTFTSPVDGYKETATKAVLADADFFAPSRTHAMTLASISNGTFDAKTEAEALWLAKYTQIMHMAGARPMALTGKNMETAIGKIQRAMYNHCLANENALIKQCTDLLAFYTKPNCSQDQDRCDRQNVTCLNATAGLTDTSVVGGCSGGLSPYQALWVEANICKSKEFYILQASAGKAVKEHLKTVDRCNQLWDELDALEAQKQDNCDRAIAALPQVERCWAAVEALGTGRYSAQLAGKDFRYYADTPYFDVVQEPKATPIHNRVEISDMPKGHIIPSDEIKWPRAVDQ